MCIDFVRPVFRVGLQIYLRNKVALLKPTRNHNVTVGRELNIFEQRAVSDGKVLKLSAEQRRGVCGRAIYRKRSGAQGQQRERERRSGAYALNGGCQFRAAPQSGDNAADTKSREKGGEREKEKKTKYTRAGGPCPGAAST